MNEKTKIILTDNLIKLENKLKLMRIALLIENKKDFLNHNDSLASIHFENIYYLKKKYNK